MISLQCIKKPIIPLPILYCCSLLFVPLCPSFFLCLDLFILFCHFPPQFLSCSFSLWIHVFILLRHTFQKLPNKGYLVNELFESLYVNMSLSSYPTGCLDIEIPVGFSHCSHLCNPRAQYSARHMAAPQSPGGMTERRTWNANARLQIPEPDLSMCSAASGKLGS